MSPRARASVLSAQGTDSCATRTRRRAPRGPTGGGCTLSAPLSRATSPPLRFCVVSCPFNEAPSSLTPVAAARVSRSTGAPGAPECTLAPGLCSSGQAGAATTVGRDNLHGGSVNYVWTCAADLPVGALPAGGGTLCYNSTDACLGANNACNDQYPCRVDYDEVRAQGSTTAVCRAAVFLSFRAQSTTRLSRKGTAQCCTARSHLSHPAACRGVARRGAVPDGHGRRRLPAVHLPLRVRHAGQLRAKRARNAHRKRPAETRTPSRCCYRCACGVAR